MSSSVFGEDDKVVLAAGEVGSAVGTEVLRATGVEGRAEVGAERAIAGRVRRPHVKKGFRVWDGREEDGSAVVVAMTLHLAVSSLQCHLPFCTNDEDEENLNRPLSLKVL